jgi:hypothetical protein
MKGSRKSASLEETKSQLPECRSSANQNNRNLQIDFDRIDDEFVSMLKSDSAYKEPGFIKRHSISLE